jgi:undecaprenyl-diphosphatase
MALRPIVRQGRRAFSLLNWIGRHQLPLLLGLAIVTGGTWSFVELADEVLEGETHSIDQSILLAMRSPADLADPLGPGWLEEIGRDLTALGGIAVLVIISCAGVGYLLLSRHYRGTLFLTMVLIGGWALSTALKAGFDRPRPDLVPHGSIVYTASFPSGHSMMAAVTYLTLGVMLARVQSHRRLKAYFLLTAIVLTLLVGISRVYLGVHWPTDVLAGWTAGAAWASLCWVLAGWLERRGKVEPAQEESDA